MRTLLVLLLVSTLSACGFHLRGAADLPYRTFYIDLPPTSVLGANLKRQIGFGEHTRIVEDKTEADGVLVTMFDRREKVILTTNTQGRVSEYQLRRNYGFRITNAKGEQIVPLSEIVLVRDMTYSDSNVLAKDQEETILWNDIEADLLQQLLRRLAATKPVAPVGE
jgi:LPS-assembly lipoprotein